MCSPESSGRAPWAQQASWGRKAHPDGSVEGLDQAPPDPPLTCTFPGGKPISALQHLALERPELAESYRNSLPLNTESRSQRFPQSVFPIIPGRTNLVSCLHAPPSTRGHLVLQHGHTYLLHTHLWGHRGACAHHGGRAHHVPREHCPMALPPGASPLPAAPSTRTPAPRPCGVLQATTAMGSGLPTMQQEECSVLQAPCLQ